MRKFTLFVGDIVILYLSLYTTLLIRYGGGFGQYLDLHVLPFSILFAIWLLVFYIFNLYELGYARNNLKFYSSVSYSIGTNSVVALLFFYLIPFFEITPKTNLFIFLLISIALLGAWRWTFNMILTRRGSGETTLIIGDSNLSRELYDYVLAHPQLGYNALGIIDVKDEEASKILEKLIIQKKARTLVLDSSVYSVPDIINILYKLVGKNINFHSLSDFYERVVGKVPLGAIDQGWFLDKLSEGRKRPYEIITRAFDIIFALIIGASTLIVAPLIALIIRQSSQGPILFKQKRVGKEGRVFTLIKFRSMTSDSPDGSAEGKTGPVWTIANDPRITKFGNFLRKTRIDELPQVWNILKGELSFVGPRAERPEFHEKLKADIPFYEERYMIKPGLTGWSQIKYQYGASVKDAEEKLKYDLYYIKNRSLLLDLGIILKTINIVARKEGR